MAEEHAEIGHDFLSQVVRGAKSRKVEIEMLEETYQDALKLAVEAGWDEKEALLGVFTYGVAYLRNQLTQSRVMDGDASHTATTEDLIKRCMELEAMYSVLKFRAYGLAKDRQILELNIAGLRPDNEGMRQRLLQYREQVDSLQSEIKRLRQENEQLKAALSQPTEPPTSPKPGLTLRALGIYCKKLLNKR